MIKTNLGRRASRAFRPQLIWGTSQVMLEERSLATNFWLTAGPNGQVQAWATTYIPIQGEVLFDDDWMLSPSPPGNGAAAATSSKTGALLVENVWIPGSGMYDPGTFTQVTDIQQTETGTASTQIVGDGSGIIFASAGHTHTDSVTVNRGGPYSLDGFGLGGGAQVTIAELSGPVHFTATANNGGAPTGSWTISFNASINILDENHNFDHDWQASLTFNQFAITINASTRGATNVPTGVTVVDTSLPIGTGQDIYRDPSFGVQEGLFVLNWTKVVPASASNTLNYYSYLGTGPEGIFNDGTSTQIVQAGFTFQVTPHD